MKNMIENSRPKRALVAYCTLAQRLNTPGIGLMQALTPFLTQACEKFAGEFYDAGKFSNAVEQEFGLKIPRLASLGIAEQLHKDGLLEILSQNPSQIAYRFKDIRYFQGATSGSPVTEEQIEKVLASFSGYCAQDKRLKDMSRDLLDSAFLDRLLNIDSLRILGRREDSIALKRNAGTLILSKLNKGGENSLTNAIELHLDFATSQFLLDLQSRDQSGFELVSDVAFANMAAETLSCFMEPLTESRSLEGLVVYLDSPILLDMLGINSEYADYGRELLETIRASGATPTVLDHCVVEAESAISAQLAYLRSGVNNMSYRWGTTAKVEILNALSGNVGESAYQRLGIAIERDPELNLYRRAETIVGDIEGIMSDRMQNWGNDAAKEHDRKSVWSMLAIRDSREPCSRICDSKWVFLSRNIVLVDIANKAWKTWLKGATRHSTILIEKWAPVSMSDKQFAGYVWLRGGGGKTAIPKARLLANCSAAVRPRPDIKAKAYNLLLELNGKDEAEHLAALFEDREGSRALMRVSNGDPEDVTLERLPYIMEQMKRAAGEYAASIVREEGQRKLEEAQQKAMQTESQHKAERDRMINELVLKEEENQFALAQKDLDRQKIANENQQLQLELAEKMRVEEERINGILADGMKLGKSIYKLTRWIIAVTFAVLGAVATYISTHSPLFSTFLTGLLGLIGFWFVPNALHKPLQWLACKRMKHVVKSKDPKVVIPDPLPNFSQLE
ncbi:MAG: hypothetical protein C4516_05545 [Oxalobacter sp.]|nr:MAG: hypothetical protein C4516_05545 [Oxalobacter sp.]